MRIKYIFILLLFAISFCAEAQYSRLLDFDLPVNGGNPRAGFYFDGTYLYGTTSSCGSSDGSVFKIKPDGTGYDTLMTFWGSNGSGNFSSLTSDGTFLYGVTSGGGLYGAGTIFKIKFDGTGFVSLYNFGSSGSDGSSSFSSLFFDGTFLYGTTNGGGITGKGTLYKILPDGTGYMILVNFSGLTNGSYPMASVVSDGTFLYGMTSDGGITDTAFGTGRGLIYKVKPDGTAFDSVMNFYGPNGSQPEGDLIFDGTYLYGATGGGGPLNAGVIFKIKPDGSGFIKLLDFVDSNGRYPSRSMTYDGTYLYGTTVLGGSNNVGVVYKLKPDGTGYYKMWDMSYAEGAMPYSSLVSDGTFLYGTASGGGANLKGVLFKLGLETSAEELDQNDLLNIYPNPANNQITLEFELAETKNISIEIRNVLGQTVKTISTNSFTKGSNKIEVEVNEFSNGLYFLQLQIGNKTIRKKFIKE